MGKYFAGKRHPTEQCRQGGGWYQSAVWGQPRQTKCSTTLFDRQKGSWQSPFQENSFIHPILLALLSTRLTRSHPVDKCYNKGACQGGEPGVQPPHRKLRRMLVMIRSWGELAANSVAITRGMSKENLVLHDVKFFAAFGNN